MSGSFSKVCSRIHARVIVTGLILTKVWQFHSNLISKENL